MRGSHHIIAGLAMLGIGRAIVTVGENVDWSQVVWMYWVEPSHRGVRGFTIYSSVMMRIGTSVWQSVCRCLSSAPCWLMLIYHTR